MCLTLMARQYRSQQSRPEQLQTLDQRVVVLVGATAVPRNGAHQPFEHVFRRTLASFLIEVMPYVRVQIEPGKTEVRFHPQRAIAKGDRVDDEPDRPVIASFVRANVAAPPVVPHEAM